jgi:hypothetical protein
MVAPRFPDLAMSVPPPAPDHSWLPLTMVDIWPFEKIQFLVLG